MLALIAPIFAAVRANWQLAAGMILGAILCAPVASCVGSSNAKASAAAKVVIASQKVEIAAAKAEAAATLTDMVRTAKTADERRELQEIVDETGSDDAAGPAVAAILERVRARQRANR